MNEPRGIYWGDPLAWALTPRQRWALQRGQIAPMEARNLLNLAAVTAPPLAETLRVYVSQGEDVARKMRAER